ncbi:f-box family protein [Corchorus olitorius]|uniref:F-box family protein n=1 Tax=Corchorus olitorius TaxID=93759 RepID=A0A1R3FY42_9ROSI|nr:f-box family protein [Corchorus olitorius]
MNSFMKYCLSWTPVEHKVEKLDICCDHNGNNFWPESFSTCQSLTALKLAHKLENSPSPPSPFVPVRLVRLPKRLDLPALKSLHLVGIPINFDPIIWFSSCPNLETVQLDLVQFTSPGILRFHSPNLRSLKISLAMRYLPLVKTYVFEIDAPKLTTFEYSGYSDIKCSMLNLSNCLDDVHFNVLKHPYGFTEKDFSLLINNFKEIRLAKSLTLALDTIKVTSYTHSSIF